MRGSRHCPRRHVHVSPASLLEALEPRVHLAAFAYTSLVDYLGVSSPLFTLRPAGEGSPARTIASDVAAAGDVDGDGTPDILVGSGGQGDPSDSGATAAVAAIYSGRTGQLLFTFSDGFSEFGASVAGVGDVNGDTTPDVLVGSPRWNADGNGNAQVGRAYLYSGVDGALLHTFTGEAAGDRFGAAVAGVGDADGDGVNDVIVGAPGSGLDRGAVSIFSGADGSLIRRILGLADHSAFGAAVAGAGDLDGDSRGDALVGAPGGATGANPVTGAVYGFSGLDGTLYRTLTGAHDRDRFGFSIGAGGDVDGDGVPDIIVGSPSFDAGNIPSAGRAVVFSGEDSAVLHIFTGDRPNGNMGAAVAIAGDANFDGRADVLVGQPSANPEARVVLFSGMTGAELTSYIARDRDLVGSDRLGSAVAPLGDITGDGIPDFVFAGTQDARPGSGDRSRMYVFSGATAMPLLPRGINDEYTMWGTAGADDGQGFLLIDGDLFILPSRGFQSRDQVVRINHGNLVLGGRDVEGRIPFLWQDGVRTELTDLITTYDGPAGDYVSMRGVDLTDTGLVLVERLRADSVATTWLYENGTLRYLFDGEPVAMNEGGMIVGRSPTEEFSSILWTASGGPVTLAGIDATQINEGGLIAGSARIITESGASIRPAVWQGGTAGGLVSYEGITGGTQFYPHGLNEAGWIVGRYLTADNTTSGFFVDPLEGVAGDIKNLVVAGAPAGFTGSVDLRLAGVNNAGLIVGRTHDSDLGFVLTPVGRGPVLAMTGSRVSAADPPSNSMAAVTLNLAQELISFRRDPVTGEWTAWNLTGLAAAPRASDAVALTDPASGRAAYAAIAEDGVYLIIEYPGGEWNVRNLTAEAAGSTAIVRGLSTFTSLDGVAYLAGIDASGDVVVYRQSGGLNDADLPVWEFQNLSEAYLRPMGFASPAYHGPLVSYVTTWNGLNIAGLDENGNIWTVWTAPALGGRWESSNLSEITGAPVLVGGLAPFLAPWGAIHIAGTDSNGDTTVTWWTPGFEGNWEKNNLTRENSFARLRPESVSSFVTSWGALNIVGLDDEGEVSTYWWVPETNTWQLAQLDLERPDRSVRPVHRLDGFATRDGSMSLFGAGSKGEVLRIHWAPGQPWLFENLTESVAG